MYKIYDLSISRSRDITGAPNCTLYCTKMSIVIQVGDRVYCCRSIEGSYKELTLTDEMDTFPLHDALGFQQGAALGGSYFTAYRALVTKAQLKAGETVLVHGASGGVRSVICTTRMWADARRDGRPAEYRCRPLLNAAKFG